MTSSTTPTKRHQPAREARGIKTAEGGDQPFSWEAFAPLAVHPTRVMILEALLWIGCPLSATMLEKMAADKPINALCYHLRCLGKMGVIEVVGTRPVRGAREKMYFFSEDHSWLR